MTRSQRTRDKLEAEIYLAALEIIEQAAAKRETINNLQIAQRLEPTYKKRLAKLLSFPAPIIHLGIIAQRVIYHWHITHQA